MACEHGDWAGCGYCEVERLREGRPSQPPFGRCACNPCEHYCRVADLERERDEAQAREDAASATRDEWERLLHAKYPVRDQAALLFPYHRELSKALEPRDLNDLGCAIGTVFARAERAEAEVERARGLLLEAERARQTDDEIKAEYLAAAVALVERAERAEAEVERLRGLIGRMYAATRDQFALAERERDEAKAEVGRLREAAEHVARVMPHGCYMSLPDGTVVEHDANSRCPGCAMRRLRAALADPAGGDA